MSILVRSQDKEFLIEALSFSIGRNLENGKIKNYSIDCETTACYESEVAVYKTKEKALKVLDMIQKQMCKIKAFERGEIVLLPRNIYAFEMPQDEEVKTE